MKVFRLLQLLVRNCRSTTLIEHGNEIAGSKIKTYTTPILTKRDASTDE